MSFITDYLYFSYFLEEMWDFFVITLTPVSVLALARKYKEIRMLFMKITSIDRTITNGRKNNYKMIRRRMEMEFLFLIYAFLVFILAYRDYSFTGTISFITLSATTLAILHHEWSFYALAIILKFYYRHLNDEI